ncbi:TIGR03085 family metal-binding protein [Ornithinimicrobium pekingense]|uniref:TIGR03085 family protein n=1 Tax=Ornithinimicrobium pekingense TaxID=384677 RepID=A0ABQ2F9C0_9MICO|nr:TIGR03085 family metal-binding protein [Ornithinimicrobium pekingense]GGK74420.1 TIGR03085 family protein [Ornithinimicrobium pekingense]
MQPVTAMRRLFADTAASLGPDAPTLCAPWTVRDLLAHEILRQSRPDALPGIGLPVDALRRRTATVQASIADDDFARLVDRVRQGPPPWWPTRVPALDNLVNLAELAVHQEDMLRARPGWSPGPSTHDEATMEELWTAFRRAAPLAYRSAPVGVVAVAPGHGRVAVRRPRATSGTVVLRGTPLELLLHAFGRDRVAQVRVEGSEADVAALAGHSREF